MEKQVFAWKNRYLRGEKYVNHAIDDGIIERWEKLFINQ